MSKCWDVVLEIEDRAGKGYDGVVPCNLEVVWHWRIVIGEWDGKSVGYRTPLEGLLLWLLLLMLLGVVEGCCYWRHHRLGRVLWHLLLRAEDVRHHRVVRAGPVDRVDEERIVCVALRLLEVLLLQGRWRPIQWPTIHCRRTSCSWLLRLADIEELSNQTSILVLLPVLLRLKSLLHET